MKLDLAGGSRGQILQDDRGHFYLCQSLLEFAELAVFSGHWWSVRPLDLPAIREVTHYGRVFSDRALAHLDHLSKWFAFYRGNGLMTS